MVPHPVTNLTYEYVMPQVAIPKGQVVRWDGSLVYLQPAIHHCVLVLLPDHKHVRGGAEVERRLVRNRNWSRETR